MSLSSSGAPSFLPPPSPGSDPALTGLYTDSAAASNAKPLHRFTVPVGALFDRSSLTQQNFFLTLANVNTGAFWDSIGFAIRATCTLADTVGASDVLISLAALLSVKQLLILSPDLNCPGIALILSSSALNHAGT